MSISYHVFSPDIDATNEFFKKREDALAYFQKRVKETPEVRWRVYLDEEDSDGSQIEEDCIEAYDPDNVDQFTPKEVRS